MGKNLMSFFFLVAEDLVPILTEEDGKWQEEEVEPSQKIEDVRPTPLGVIGLELRVYLPELSVGQIKILVSHIGAQLPKTM